jgi:hypothetical protein
MISNYIESHLHELTPTRPITVPLTNVTITIDDFNKASGWRTLGEVLADPALTELVVADLTIIANEMWRITE